MSYSPAWKALARRLLGSAPRCAVAAFFATVDDGEWVRQEDIRQGTGLLQGQVHKATRELAELGLLKVHHQGPLQWPHYQRTASRVWEGMATVCAAMSDLADASDGPTDEHASEVG